MYTALLSVNLPVLLLDWIPTGEEGLSYTNYENKAAAYIAAHGDIRWELKADGTVDPSIMKGDWAGTELVSPVMCRDTNKRDVYWTQEIAKALAVLNTRGIDTCHPQRRIGSNGYIQALRYTLFTAGEEEEEVMDTSEKRHRGTCARRKLHY